ncbi:LysR family transcriptional regulator [Komagataeibacter oboediens DSM 11826]|uniref:LysR family transcriptional regulator n=1 Tax=Komagataeibacter oboediens TaxID=65958 RepID=A0A318R332_9PROT|nr:LysR family transcriptional regulator [Komagataeibacter oboediens]PYD80283.1 LysR family transcriptional regulator [Komagataeibacter oboediens]GBQ07660.1 LysR family transcriptional regulator [Komagataeibacter oboediens DSM 11826]
MDYFTALRVFLRASQVRSFSGVAAELGMEVSTVSRHISRLEADLAVALFNRTTRGLHLTEAGGLLQARASRIMADLDHAREEVTLHNASPQGLLRINVPGCFGRRHVMPHMAAFLADFPDIRADVMLTDTTVDLIESGTDVAIRIGALPDSTLVARRLATQSRMVVGTPAYIARAGRPETPDDLRAHSCLLFTLHCGNAWYYRPDGATDTPFEKLPVTGLLKANESEALLDATLQGIGLALLPDWLTGPYLRQGRLVRVLADFEWVLAPGAERAIWAVYPPKKVVAPKVRSFIHFMSRRFRDPLYWDPS